MTNKTLTNKKTPRKGLLERRERILKAAAEVFAEKGLEKATVDDIAERAGMGKGTIYRRVGKKKDLITLLIEISAKLVIDNIKSEIKRRTDPILQFKEAIYALCDFYEKNMNLVAVFVSCATINADAYFIKSAAAQKNIEAVFSLVENILQKAVKRRQLRSIDTRAVTKGLVEFLNPYFYKYLRDKRDYTKGEIAQLVIDLFLDGLRVKK